jgi:hypothetical protein
MGKFRFREVVVCVNKLTNPRSFPSGSDQTVVAAPPFRQQQSDDY